MKNAPIYMASAASILFLAASEPATAQRDVTRDQHDVLRASIEYVGARMPQGAVLDVSISERFATVEQPAAFLRALAAEAGLGAVDVRPLVVACGDRDKCGIGVPAYLDLTPARIFQDRAEARVSWVYGQSGKYGLRNGRSVVLRLVRRNERWQVSQEVHEEGFTTGPAPRKSSK